MATRTEKVYYSTTLNTLSCGSCHIPFALPQSMHQNLLNTGNWFYCPNGHRICYSETTNSRLQKEQERLEQRLKWAREDNERQRRQRLAAERSAIAYKGVATKAKRRADHAMCPVEGCHRHFANVERHIDRMHPDYQKQGTES